MNQNTAGAVLVLILAAAGFVNDKPAAWGLVALSAALAFLKAELDRADVLFNWPELQWAAAASALASWVAVIAAATILAL